MIKRANGRGFCMLGFVSVKELKEQRMAINAFLWKRCFCMSQCLSVLADRCVMQVYHRKLPVVFDILNGHHEHQLGTFTFSPVFDSRLLRSLLALRRSLLQSKHFGSDFDIFLHKLINSYVM